MLQTNRYNSLTHVAGSHSTSGDNTVIAAPASGKQVVISSFVIQNESGTDTTVLLKFGAATVLRLVLPAKGDGIMWQFPDGLCWKAGDAAAVVVNLSGANAVAVSVSYWLDTA